MNPIEPLAQEYLDLKDTITELEVSLKELREAIVKGMEGDAPEATYVFPQAEIVRVKGRVTKKLDRKELVKLGISGALLDAGTKITQGAPTIRITRPKVETITASAGGPSGPAV